MSDSGVGGTGTIIGVIVMGMSMPVGDECEYLVMLDERLLDWPYDAVAMCSSFITPTEEIDFDQLAQDIFES